MGKLVKIERPNRYNSGFTFIEMIVVVGVIALMIPALFTIIYTLLAQQMRIYRLAYVKRQGDYVMNLIETNIRSATSLHQENPDVEVCNTVNMPYSSVSVKNISASDKGFYMVDNTNNRLQFWIGLDKHLYSSKYDLTGRYVKYFNVGTQPFIMCRKSASYSPPTVTVAFDIVYDASTSTRAEEQQVKLTYRNTVQLKSY